VRERPIPSSCRCSLPIPLRNNRGPLTASGIYQIIIRRGRRAGLAVYPHRFRHHFSHTRLDQDGPVAGERLVLATDAVPLRRQRPISSCTGGQRPRA